MTPTATGSELTEEQFTWRDGSIHWSRQGQGPPVVMCHGTPWSSALWDDVAKALAPSRTVYRWDMLGYGASQKRAGQDVSLGAQAELFAALLSSWELDSPDVVAHDYGGAVALRAHLLHGQKFASMVLVDVVALAPWGSPFFRLVAEHAAVFEQLPPPLHEALVRSYVAGAAHRELRGQDLDRLVEPWLGPVGQAAFYRQIAQADQRFTDEIEPLYPELDLPVHIVWGAEDAWIPPDRANTLRDVIPGATLHVVEGAGHLIQLDAPAELVMAISEGLDRARGPGQPVL